MGRRPPTLPVRAPYGYYRGEPIYDWNRYMELVSNSAVTLFEQGPISMGYDVGPAPEVQQEPRRAGYVPPPPPPPQRAGCCWKCGDQLPSGAPRFCIVCGVEQPPATGPTTKLER